MSETAGATAAADAGPGRMLASLRGERNLSVADVAQRLKYGARQIEALEAEEFGKLPGATFVRGMVRGYAKLLEIDPDPVLKALAQRYVPEEIAVDLRAKRIPFPEGGRRGTRIYHILSLLLLVAMAAVAYEWRMGAFPLAMVGMTPPQPKAENQPVVNQPPAPAAAPTTPAPAVAYTPVAETPRPQASPQPKPQVQGTEARIRLEFEGESWVEVTDAGGKTLMSQLNLPGTRRVVTGQPPLSLVIGNATAVHLTYNDNMVDLKPYIQIEVARLVLN